MNWGPNLAQKETQNPEGLATLLASLQPTQQDAAKPLKSVDIDEPVPAATQSREEPEKLITKEEQRHSDASPPTKLRKTNGGDVKAGSSITVPSSQDLEQKIQNIDISGGPVDPCLDSVMQSGTSTAAELPTFTMRASLPTPGDRFGDVRKQLNKNRIVAAQQNIRLAESKIPGLIIDTDMTEDACVKLDQPDIELEQQALKTIDAVERSRQSVATSSQVPDTVCNMSELQGDGVGDKFTSIEPITATAKLEVKQLQCKEHNGSNRSVATGVANGMTGSKPSRPNQNSAAKKPAELNNVLKIPKEWLAKMNKSALWDCNNFDWNHRDDLREPDSD